MSGVVVNVPVKNL